MKKKLDSRNLVIKPKTIKNLDSVKGKRTGRGYIEQSEHFMEYDRWLKSGWSTRFCSRKAFELFGENISHQTFANYVKKIPPGEVLQSDILRKKLVEADLIIEALHELDVAIYQTKGRIDKGLEFEKKSPLPLVAVDNEFRLLHDLLKTRLQLEGRLKEVPQTAVAVSNNIDFEKPSVEDDEASDIRFIRRMEEVANKLKQQMGLSD